MGQYGDSDHHPGLPGCIGHRVFYAQVCLPGCHGKYSNSHIVILYWVIRQLQVQQHYFDNREILLLFFEAMVIVLAAIYIFSIQKNPGLKVMQSIFFGIHFLVLILGLVFMLTFKITKLM
jgi:hypothetical protein